MSTEKAHKGVLDNYPKVIEGSSYNYMNDPSAFKGTIGNWKEDIGIDELESDLFRVIVTSDGKTVAHAFGTTADEAMRNAKAIAKAPNLLLALQEVTVKLIEVHSEPKKRYWKDSVNYWINTLTDLSYSVTKP